LALTASVFPHGEQAIAIHAKLAAALPAMAPAIDAMGVEDTNLFHIFDVMMRENREAVITEFTVGQV
jgi:hypothetical protein